MNSTMILPWLPPPLFPPPPPPPPPPPLLLLLLAVLLADVLFAFALAFALEVVDPTEGVGVGVGAVAGAGVGVLLSHAGNGFRERAIDAASSDSPSVDDATVFDDCDLDVDPLVAVSFFIVVFVNFGTPSFTGDENNESDDDDDEDIVSTPGVGSSLS
ncbi:hypothetical protein EDD21DRAFT_359910 [Dissophora ornata]|nr:hypothetical protein EDD21DRAFT_359910 [Dissophora ornata]